MPTRMAAVLLLSLSLAAACGGGGGVERTPNDPPRDQPPVALDAEPQVTYPPELYSQGIEGRVVLRLFVGADGVIVPDSTQVHESSGVPGLDSAAIAAAPALRFAPALRGGEPAAVAFFQAFDFRRPGAQ